MTTKNYKYSLDKGSKKHHCPNCGKKRFVRYINFETNEYLPAEFGRCDRESKCGYFVDPYSNGYAKAIREQEQGNKTDWKRIHPRRNLGKPEIVFFDFDTFRQTLEPERYEKNTFLQNLFYRVQFPFEADAVTKIIELYRLGTIAKGYRSGGITFPFIDIKDNVRAVQVKQFDENNNTTATDFLHSIIEKHYTRSNKPLPEWLGAYTKQDKRITCLFGEHLLNKYPNADVWLFEAPKTAIYSTLYFGFPEQANIICLAVYNKSSFSLDRIKVLQRRFVYVFPDLSKDGNTFKEWETKAKEFQSRLPGTQFIFSDLLEQLAPQQDKKLGNDIADYLIKLDWRKTRSSAPKQKGIIKVPDDHKPKDRNTVILLKPTIEDPLPDPDLFKGGIFTHPTSGEGYCTHKIKQSGKWDKEVTELENYFISIEIPKHPIKLNRCGTIIDCHTFVLKHLAMIKGNNGNKTFLPYLERLRELKRILN